MSNFTVSLLYTPTRTATLFDLKQAPTPTKTLIAAVRKDLNALGLPSPKTENFKTPRAGEVQLSWPEAHSQLRKEYKFRAIQPDYGQREILAERGIERVVALDRGALSPTQLLPPTSSTPKSKPFRRTWQPDSPSLNVDAAAHGASDRDSRNDHDQRFTSTTRTHDVQPTRPSHDFMLRLEHDYSNPLEQRLRDQTTLLEATRAKLQEMQDLHAELNRRHSQELESHRATKRKVTALGNQEALHQEMLEAERRAHANTRAQLQAPTSQSTEIACQTEEMDSFEAESERQRLQQRYEDAKRENRVFRQRCDDLEAELGVERRKRKRSERDLEDFRSESKNPFIVPALFDAYLDIIGVAGS